MKQSNIFILGILSVLATLLLSCNNDDSNDNPGDNSGKIALRIVRSLPDVTKAETVVGEDNLNENLITSLDVFIYQEGQDACTFYQHIVPAEGQTGNDDYVVTLNAEQALFAKNATYKTYVVANYPGQVPDSGLTLSALQSLQVSELNPDKIQDSFVMEGSSDGVLNDGLVTNKEISVSLLRLAAKIRVSTTYTNGFKASSSQLISKRLMRYATNSLVLESNEPFVTELKDMESFTDIVSRGGKDRIAVYSYPNDWNDNLQNETYLIMNIPVTGPDGKEYVQNYYKVPVNFRLPADNPANPDQEAQQKALYKLQRNHLYDITILIDKPGSSVPESAVLVSANYAVKNWSTKDILVAVEGFNYIYVEQTIISMPNKTSFTTTFQSSSPDVEIADITVNGQAVSNGSEGVNITCSQGVKSGDIKINSSLPIHFVGKEITFNVKNGAGLSQQVSVTQYPALYISSDISADEPGGSQGQDNNKMYVIGSFVADFSALPDPDEFDEDFGNGYTHYAPNPELGKTYAEYIRNNAVFGYPLIDDTGATIDTEENNRRVSPRLMLASQYGTTTADSYSNSKDKCRKYVENDATTNETYSDWRMPTLAEVYLIDILQNIRVAEVKKILEGKWYWSARASSTVEFMDPRVGNTANFNPLNAAVRCVRDVKIK